MLIIRSSSKYYPNIRWYIMIDHDRLSMPSSFVVVGIAAAVIAAAAAATVVTRTSSRRASALLPRLSLSPPHRAAVHHCIHNRISIFVAVRVCTGMIMW